MGIKDLWHNSTQLVDDAAFTCKLSDFILEHGFIREHYGARTVVIGIDISSFLDGFRAADMIKGGLHTSSSTLTQLFKFFCGLSKANAHCLIVWDGDNRPSIKRGHRVVAHESDYQKKAKLMVTYFGYHNHTAPGEAEAELAELLKRGIIDTVLSKDSDVFPLGVKSVLKVLKPNTAVSGNSWEDLTIRVYDAEPVQKYLGYSQGGLVLVALLLQNDISGGVNGIGRQTAHALARSGFGKNLLDYYNMFSTKPGQLSWALSQLNEDMADEIEHNKRGQMGCRSPMRSKILRESNFPTDGDLQTLHAFLKPVTSSSLGLQPVPMSLRLPTLPDIGKILAFCNDHFSWSSKLTLEHFHICLWPGVLIRMLSSKYLAYNPVNSEIIVPRLQSHFEMNSKGGHYMPTYSTTIITKNLLDSPTKNTGDSISVTFSTTFFVELMHLNPAAKSMRSRRIDVPVAMIAVALNRFDKVNGLSRLIGPRPPPVVNQDRNAEASSSSQASFVNIPSKRKQTSVGESRIKRNKASVKSLGIIELTDSETNSENEDALA
ncbi:PIN domain-like protein [Lentinula edodes]|uniref:PIN domain-like protein n=1 Tax=Lentinula edodes TaxID=5353 RepID=UPI001E8EED1E|nr:PIN domain-like protein [Lentinula edodes]KAH7871101.1 PIN domain-like protein [Lentinula edodes]